MKIYLASSWRNKYHGVFLALLKNNGYDVYDFKEDGFSFHWSQIDEDYKNWNGQQFVSALYKDLAISGFDRDFDMLNKCDVCVMLLPCGKSAHIEAGYAVGSGKKLIIVNPYNEKIEPELMYKMAHRIVFSQNQLLNALNFTL